MWEHFKFRLNYLKVRTTEGGGVLHVLIRKKREVPLLDQAFLKRTWDEVHGAEQVWIEEIKADPEKGLHEAMKASFYVCGNYFNQQPVVRQSSSYSWIFRGAAAVWSRGKKVFAPKRKKHEYHPACFCHDCQQKDGRHYIYKEELKRDPYFLSKKTSTPNYAIKRPSLIQLCMESRKAGSRKDSGYDNALFLWLKLTRNPPKDTRQVKLTRWLDGG